MVSQRDRPQPEHATCTPDVGCPGLSQCLRWETDARATYTPRRSRCTAPFEDRLSFLERVKKEYEVPEEEDLVGLQTRVS